MRFPERAKILVQTQSVDGSGGITSAWAPYQISATDVEVPCRRSAPGGGSRYARLSETHDFDYALAVKRTTPTIEALIQPGKRLRLSDADYRINRVYPTRGALGLHHFTVTITREGDSNG